MKIYSDFSGWAEKYKNQTFRMWIYKKAWTPWEEKNCKELDTPYVQDTCDFVILREIVMLPNGEIMIGYTLDEGDEVTDEYNYVSYVMLSDIELSWYKGDQEHE